MEDAKSINNVRLFTSFKGNQADLPGMLDIEISGVIETLHPGEQLLVAIAAVGPSGPRWDDCLIAFIDHGADPARIQSWIERLGDELSDSKVADRSCMLVWGAEAMFEALRVNPPPGNNALNELLAGFAKDWQKHIDQSVAITQISSAPAGPESRFTRLMSPMRAVKLAGPLIVEDMA